ncbi:hypothetical protein Tco_0826336 [Tanacetum coccineum]
MHCIPVFCTTGLLLLFRGVEEVSRLLLVAARSANGFCTFANLLEGIFINFVLKSVFRTSNSLDMRGSCLFLESADILSTKSLTILVEVVEEIEHSLALVKLASCSLSTHSVSFYKSGV